MQDGTHPLIIKARSIVLLQQHGAGLFYFADAAGIYNL